jgi:hypothetical protein
MFCPLGALGDSVAKTPKSKPFQNRKQNLRKPMQGKKIAATVNRAGFRSCFAVFAINGSGRFTTFHVATEG